MKKTAALLFGLAGVFASAQSSVFMFNNYNVYDAVGRMMVCSPVPGAIKYMYVAPNAPYGTYTIPAGMSSFYTSFGTTGLAPYPMAMNTWYMTDPANTNNNATYAYNDPFITGTMSAINEWASFHFTLRDSANNGLDTYLVGDPAIASNAGVTAVPYQLGPNTGIDADWFTITTASGKVTYFNIY